MMAEDLHQLPRELAERLLFSDIINWIAYRNLQKDKERDVEAQRSGRMILRARNING